MTDSAPVRVQGELRAGGAVYDVDCVISANQLRLIRHLLRLQL